jgi:hypothetical protein
MVANEFVQLFERAFIEQQIDSFTRGQLARFVFALAALWPASGFSFFAAAPQLCNPALLRIRVCGN